MLEGMEIPYMLTGSLALNIYTMPRATRDIDFIIEIKQKDVKRFTDALKDNYYYYEPAILEEIRRQGMFNIIHLVSSYKIDLIVRSADAFEVAKFRNRRMIDYLGNSLFVISPEDLIISKLRWIQSTESELHKRDISNLLKYPQLDMDYIIEWCKQLKLKTFNLINDG